MLVGVKSDKAHDFLRDAAVLDHRFDDDRAQKFSRTIASTCHEMALAEESLTHSDPLPGPLFKNTGVMN